PAIAEEFRLVGNEMLAGKTRHEALRALADRTGVTDVRGLTSLLIQADQFGTSVARALRIQASEMRVTRILRAEEKAHKIPAKLQALAGVIYDQIARYDLADHHYKLALELQPESLAIKNNYALSKLRWAQASGRLELATEAMALLDEAARIDDKNETLIANR